MVTWPFGPVLALSWKRVSMSKSAKFVRGCSDLLTLKIAHGSSMPQCRTMQGTATDNEDSRT